MKHQRATTLPLRTDTLGVRIGEVDVTVRSCHERVLDDFAGLYEGFPNLIDTDRPGIAVEVRRARSFRKSCRVFGEGEAIGPSVRADEALPFVEWGINYSLIARRTDYLQVHAAVLSRHGHGVLFAAQSGSGKSTLAAGLIARGWKYLSDEIALVDPRTLYVHPFPKALCVKSGAFAEVRNLDLPFCGKRYYVKGAKGQVAYVNPLCLGADAIGKPCPVRYVILPRYVPGGAASLLRISQAQAAFELARNGMNRGAFRARAVSLFTEIAQGSQCFSLRTGPLAETGALLDALLDSRLG